MAQDMFKAGKFAQAKELGEKLWRANRKSYSAALLMGRIGLLQNRLDEAEKWLQRAGSLRPGEGEARSLLAEVFYRRDDFQQAAVLFRAAGKEAIARKLESFGAARPYLVEGRQAGVARVKFLHTDPLPLVVVRVNGSKEGNFLIDTGGSEVILDPEFAREVGAARFGSETGTFGGGKQAGYEHGRINALTLGEVVVRNLPVHILETRRFSAAARGKRVDGILGTVLLYHFLSTLDYPRGELILRRRSRKNLRAVEREAREQQAVVLPFWMAGDHYVVAWGRLNRSGPVLLFVDTGLAGAGFTGPESILQQAGISLGKVAGEGMGGGGKMKVIPFLVQELALGDAREQRIAGFFGPFPPSLEEGLGFRIGGIISHTFFRPYSLTLDFTRMRLYLKRADWSE